MTEGQGAGEDSHAWPLVAGSFFLSDFPLEWSVLAGLAILELWLTRRIGVSISLPPESFFDLALALVLSIACRTDRRAPHPKVALCADCFALWFFGARVFRVLSYLCAVSPYSLIDQQLIRADQAMGFDWPDWFRLVWAHPALFSVFGFAYSSFVYQAAGFVMLFSALGRKDRLQEIIWAFLLSLLLTCGIFGTWPALGPPSAFDVSQWSDVDLHGTVPYLKDLMALRTKTDLHFVMNRMHGIISFPSFHAALAIIFSYAFRRCWALGPVVALVNLGVLASIPVIGGHYLIDVIAGAGVAFVSIVGARLMMRYAFGYHSLSEQD